jgi:transcriptional regulator with XRE-family HTH domain
MKYRNRLRVLRAAARGGKGLSQLDTALKAKIKHYRYWRIENGYVIPDEAERARLAKVLGVPEDTLEPEAMAS